MDTIGHWQAAFGNLLQELITVRNDIARGMADLDARYGLYETKDPDDMDTAAQRAWVRYGIYEDIKDRLDETITDNAGLTGLRLEMISREMMGETRTEYKVLHLVPDKGAVQQTNQDGDRIRG